MTEEQEQNLVTLLNQDPDSRPSSELQSATVDDYMTAEYAQTCFRIKVGKMFMNRSDQVESLEEVWFTDPDLRE